MTAVSELKTGYFHEPRKRGQHLKEVANWMAGCAMVRLIILMIFAIGNNIDYQTKQLFSPPEFINNHD